MRDDLDERLHELAGTAGGAGHLPTAAQLRRTGARRRRVRTGVAGVVAAAVVVGVAVSVPLLQAGPAPTVVPAAPADIRPTPDPTPPAATEPVDPTPPTVTEPTATGPTATGPTDGPGATGHAPPPDRQVVLGTPDGRLLTVGEDGYLTSTENGVGAATALVLVPVAPGAQEYLVKTAELASWGEPACLFSTGEGDEPGRGVAVTACDASDATQLWSTAPGTDPGTISLGIGGFWLSVDGILVSMSGDHPTGTPLTPIDQGPYTDPFD